MHAFISKIHNDKPMQITPASQARRHVRRLQNPCEIEMRTSGTSINSSKTAIDPKWKYSGSSRTKAQTH